jgi:hypothetical protein
MASAMHFLKKGQINTAPKGAMAIVLDTGVGYGSSVGIGYLHTRYRDKWFGKKAPHLVAAAGKGAAILLSMLSGGHPTFASTLANSAGQAGVNALGLELGLRLGAKKAGMTLAMVPGSLPGNAVAIGALGTAAPGRSLSWNQLEDLAASH